VVPPEERLVYLFGSSVSSPINGRWSEPKSGNTLIPQILKTANRLIQYSGVSSERAGCLSISRVCTRCADKENPPGHRQRQTGFLRTRAGIHLALSLSLLKRWPAFRGPRGAADGTIQLNRQARRSLQQPEAVPALCFELGSSAMRGVPPVVIPPPTVAPGELQFPRCAVLGFEPVVCDPGADGAAVD
jgi:hypothetical protein